MTCGRCGKKAELLRYHLASYRQDELGVEHAVGASTDQYCQDCITTLFELVYAFRRGSILNWMSTP